MTKSNFTRFNNQDDRLPEFSLMSKKMGLGYFEDLVNGVKDTILLTNKQLSELDFDKAGVSIPTKLKKV